MTFYEELGVPPDAPPETIRDAYRKMARLLHPDVQTDPILKDSSEAQMKRINHLYGVLSDPDLRRRYDHDLAIAAERPAPIFVLSPPPVDRFQRRNTGTLVWLAATGVCAASILWLAARESSSTPAVYPLLSSAGQSSAPSRSEARPRIPSAVPKAQPALQHDDELAVLRGQLLAADTERKRPEKQMASAAAPVNLAPAPVVAPQPPSEISLPAVLPPAAAPPSSPKTASPPRVEPRWAGSWAYRPSHDGNQSQALLPPEFIETVITEDNCRIRGRYHARFQVADAGISPDVDFRFEGKVSGPAGRLSWTGTGGAKGEVQLRLVSDTSLEIVWSASSLGNSMGLASGTAVLNRMN